MLATSCFCPADILTGQECGYSGWSLHCPPDSWRSPHHPWTFGLFMMNLLHNEAVLDQRLSVIEQRLWVNLHGLELRVLNIDQ